MQKKSKNWTICCAFHVEEFHRWIFFHDGGWRKIAWACSFHNRMMLHVYTGQCTSKVHQMNIAFYCCRCCSQAAYAYSMENDSSQSLAYRSMKNCLFFAKFHIQIWSCFFPFDLFIRKGGVQLLIQSSTICVVFK